MAEFKPQGTSQVLQKLKRSLTRALDAEEPAEKNYHVRTALQTMEVVSESRVDD